MCECVCFFAPKLLNPRKSIELKPEIHAGAAAGVILFDK